MYAVGVGIISYQAITGNNNPNILIFPVLKIISYQAITGNNNKYSKGVKGIPLYHTKR